MIVAALVLSSVGAGQDPGNESFVPSPAGIRTKDLRQIIKELEESDYGGYGSWGNFKIRREYRENKASTRYSPGYKVVELEDPRQGSSQQLVSSPTPTSLIDYYSPQNSKELVLLFEKAKLIKDPIQAFNPRRVLTSTSFCKLSLIIGSLHILSYLSVSKRHLPLEEYNAAYKAILFRLASSFIWPVVSLSFLFRFRDVDINRLIDIYSSAFFISYPLLCSIEKALATFVRLVILRYAM